MSDGVNEIQLILFEKSESTDILNLKIFSNGTCGFLNADPIYVDLSAY